MGLKENIESARQAGFSEQEIQDRLRSEFSPKIQAAKQQGHSPEQIRARFIQEGLPEESAFDLTATPAERLQKSASQAAGAAGEAAKKLPGAIFRPLQLLPEKIRPQLIEALETKAREKIAEPIREAVKRRAEEIAEESGRQGAIDRAIGLAGAGAMRAGAEMVPLTPAELGVQMVLPAAIRTAGATARGLRIPVLGQTPGEVADIIRRRLGIAPRPGAVTVLTPEEAAAAAASARDVTPRVEPAPPESPPAPAGLPAPAPRPQLPLIEPVQGEGFQMINPMRRVYSPRLGEVDFPATSEPLQAISRRLGLPEAPPEATKGPPMAPGAPETHPQARLTKALAKAVLNDPVAPSDPAKMDLAVDLIRAGKASDAQIKTFVGRLNVRYGSTYRTLGPDAPETRRAAGALERLGMKPKPPEVGPMPIPPAQRGAAGQLEGPPGHTPSQPVSGPPEPPKPLSTESILPAPGGKGAEMPSPEGTFFPAPSKALPRSVTEHPDFVKVDKDATAVVLKYAQERGVRPSQDFFKVLRGELHDAVNEIRFAPQEKKAEVYGRIAAKYPDIDAEWTALQGRMWAGMDEASFDVYVKGKYGALRPRAGLEAEAAAQKVAAEEQAFLERTMELGQEPPLGEDVSFPPPETPVLDLIRRRGGINLLESRGFEGELSGLTKKELGESLAHSGRGGKGISRMAEEAFEEGLIAEHSENALLDAINRELRGGGGAGALAEQIPETPRPGQAGSIFPGKPHQEPGRPLQPTPTLDELHRVVREVPAEPKKGLFETIGDWARDFKRRHIDYTAPLEALEKKAAALLGRSLEIGERVYMRKSLLNSKVEGRVDLIFQELREPLNELARYGALEDTGDYLALQSFSRRIRLLEDRVKRYLASGDPKLIAEAKEVQKMLDEDRANPGFFDEAKIQAALSELKTKLDATHPALFPKAQQMADRIWSVFERLRDAAVDVGLVSPEARETMVRAGRGYVPVEDLAAAADELAGVATNLGQQYRQIVQRLGGTVRPIRDPIASVINKIPKFVYAIEQARVRQSLVALQPIPGMENSIVKLKSTQDPPKGFELFVVHQGGIKQRYAIEKSIADIFRALPAEEAGVVSILLRASYGLLRGTATAWNLGWVPGNLIVDSAETMMVSPAGIRPGLRGIFLDPALIAADIVKAFADIALGSDAYKEAVRAGALFGTGRQRAVTPEVWKQQLKPQERLQEWGEYLLQLLPRLIDIFEKGPKLAAYKRLRAQGASAEGAAFEALRFAGTPDVGRRGATSRQARGGVSLDIIYMFYNMGKQGTWRLFEAAGKRPAEFATALAATAVSYITINEWNRRQKGWEKVPPYEKQNNFVLMLGDTYVDREGNEIPKRITIRMPHGLKPVTAAIGGILESIEKKSGRPGIEGLMNAVLSLSPVNIQVDLDRPLTSVLSSSLSGLNPLIKTPFELLMNYDTFRQREIESASMRQVHPFLRARPSTSPVLSAITRRLAPVDPATGLPMGGISPALLQHAIYSGTAGVGGFGLQAAEAIARKTHPGLLPPERPARGFERLTETPIVRRFVGRPGVYSPPLEQLYEFQEGRKLDKGTTKLLVAQAILENIANPTPESKARLQQTLRGAARVDPEIPVRAQKAAIEELGKSQISKAFDVFMGMPESDRNRFVAELGKSEKGLALRAQLFNEFRKREATEP